MSKDKACISAVKEVCQRCHLYKENCGMLDCPDQCSISGRYVDGYRQAEKDLELTWEDVSKIRQVMFDYNRQLKPEIVENKASLPKDEEYCREVLNRFKKGKG